MAESINSDKTRINVPGRSEGDGMENVTFDDVSKNFNQINGHNLSKDYPRYFATPLGKRKEPKFVPYEPYKAAISPLSPNLQKKEINDLNLDHVIDSQKIDSLASKLIKKHNSYDFSSKISHKNVENFCDFKCNKCEDRINYLEAKIQLLEKEKNELESQFNIQTQVNQDLKKMLVASLGEDMQLKVQYMTEDKVKLGKDILYYIEELKQKNEEIDKLSVESDIWKTKFEASSLMVDELAGWKAVLSQKLNEATNILDLLLKEHGEIYDHLEMAFKNLLYLQSTFDPGAKNISLCASHPWNLLYIAKEIKNISIQIQERLLGSFNVVNKSSLNENIRHFTPAESAAYEVVSNIPSISILIKNNSHKGTKQTLGAVACENLPHECFQETVVNCCKHCSGEMVVL